MYHPRRDPGLIPDRATSHLAQVYLADGGSWKMALKASERGGRRFALRPRSGVFRNVEQETFLHATHLAHVAPTTEAAIASRSRASGDTVSQRLHYYSESDTGRQAAKT